MQSAWSGIRPLALDPSAKGNTANALRDHIVHVSEDKLVTVTGAKPGILSRAPTLQLKVTQFHGCAPEISDNTSIRVVGVLADVHTVGLCADGDLVSCSRAAPFTECVRKVKLRAPVGFQFPVYPRSSIYSPASAHPQAASGPPTG